MPREGRKSEPSGFQGRAIQRMHPVPYKTVIGIAAVLAAVVLFIYAPAGHYGFLSFDDPVYVTENPKVISGLTGQSVWWAFTSGHASNWHPMTWLSHMLDVEIHGMNAGGHHLTSILLHLANAVLLFWMLYRATGAWRRSAVVSILFAVHPLHVESVAWIAERKDVLSTLFWLLTMHAYVSYVRRPCLNRYLAVVVLFALGLMSKPMLVTLPLVLLLFDIWPLDRVRFGTDQRGIWLRLFYEKIPLFLLTAASSIVTVIVQWRGGAVQNFEVVPLSQRAANALVSYIAYLGRMLWPGNLAAYYPYGSLSVWLVGASALVIGAVTVILIRLSRGRSFLFVGWLWYVFTLVPVIGLIQVGGQARADRYTYIPLVGVFIIAVWGATAILERRRFGSLALKIAACILVFALAARARNQVRYWESDLVLWKHAVQATGANPFARTNLGLAFIDAGDYASGIEQYTEALKIKPDAVETRNALGVAFFKQGNLDAAMKQFDMVLRINPGFAETHSNRGMVLAQRGNIEDAFAEFRKALESIPDNPKVLYNFGFALAGQGRMDEAMSYYRNALAVKPNYADALFQMGNILVGKGMLSEAAVEYAKALEIRPEYEDAHNNLGVILLRQDRNEEAIAHFEEALRINPNSFRARENLNRALAKRQ